MKANRSYILKALARIVRPLVKILIRNGVSFKACSDVIKWCYVDVATKDFALAGKRQTKSRVAVITGLTWIDVSRLQDEEQPFKNGGEDHYHRATRVLSAWAEDENFQDSDGKPLEIPLDNDAISFASLVNDYSGGATVKSVLDDVLYNGAVEQIGKHRLKLLKPYYLTTYDADKHQSISVLGMCAGDLIQTIEHNIQPEQTSPWFQRAIFQRNLPIAALPEAKKYIAEESQILADKVDKKLASLEKKYHDPLDETYVPHVGLGLYYFQSPEPSTLKKGNKS
ncbi:MAG: DUF6502 family protein [bacterium]